MLSRGGAARAPPRRAPPAAPRPLPAAPAGPRPHRRLRALPLEGRGCRSQLVLAYPRYYTLDALPLPMGRRYQPGGIPLASHVGDSLEFVGTREYREGDPLRKIHWRSWARLGKPVVKEYQEEYFSRIALVLDTFLPKAPPPRARALRGRDLAPRLGGRPLQPHRGGRRHPGRRARPLRGVHRPQPRVPRQRARRARRLEPSPAPAFESIGPPLFGRLERLTTLVAVLLEWDEAREAFLRRVRAMGVAVRILLVHEGETRKPWSASRRPRRHRALHPRAGRGAPRRRGGAREARAPDRRPSRHAVALAAAIATLSLRSGTPRPPSSPRCALLALPPLPRVDVRSPALARLLPRALALVLLAGILVPGSAGSMACCSTTTLVPRAAGSRGPVRLVFPLAPRRFRPAHVRAVGPRLPSRPAPIPPRRLRRLRSAVPARRRPQPFAEAYVPLAVLVLLALVRRPHGSGPRWRARTSGIVLSLALVSRPSRPRVSPGCRCCSRGSRRPSPRRSSRPGPGLEGESTLGEFAELAVSRTARPRPPVVGPAAGPWRSRRWSSPASTGGGGRTGVRGRRGSRGERRPARRCARCRRPRT